MGFAIESRIQSRFVLALIVRLRTIVIVRWLIPRNRETFHSARLLLRISGPSVDMRGTDAGNSELSIFEDLPFFSSNHARIQATIEALP